VSIVARGFGDDALIVTWGLGRKAAVIDFGPWTPSPMVATAVFSAVFPTIGFEPLALVAGTQLSASHQATYLVSPSEMLVSTTFSAIFSGSPGQFQAGSIIARAFLGAEFGGFKISAQALTAGTSFAAEYALQGLVAQVAACIARANCSASTIEYLVQDFLSDLYRANLPQEVTDEERDRLPTKLPLPPELQKIGERLPDKLPTLDCW
jgi:hypothetical protein